jgi:hypothetical protein
MRCSSTPPKDFQEGSSLFVRQDRQRPLNLRNRAYPGRFRILTAKNTGKGRRPPEGSSVVTAKSESLAEVVCQPNL